MKFEIQKTKLINILSEFTTILKENYIKPQLSCVYIEVASNQLSFKGTNLETDLVIRENIENATDGKILIKPNLILEYIKLLNEDVVTLEKLENTLKINNAEFQYYDVNTYPEISENIPISISKKDSTSFLSMISKVKFVQSSESMNIVGNSIKIIFSKNSTEMVATDTYRLVYLKQEDENFIDKDILVSCDGLITISKLLKDYNDFINIGISDNNLILNWKNTYFSTKLQQINFPNFKMLLDNNSFNKNILLKNDSFQTILRRVISVTKNSNSGKYSSIFEFLNNTLSLSGYSTSAKTKQKIDIIKDGENFKTGLNAKFVMDFIENIEKDKTIKIKALDSMSMIKISEENIDNYIYMLMPINIGN